MQFIGPFPMQIQFRSLLLYDLIRPRLYILLSNEYGKLSLVLGFSCPTLFLPIVTLRFRQFGLELASVGRVGQLNKNPEY